MTVSTKISVEGDDYSKQFSSIIQNQTKDENPTSFATARALHDEFIETVEAFGAENGWKHEKVKQGDDRIESKIQLWNKVHQTLVLAYTSEDVGFTPQELWTKLGIPSFESVFTDEYRQALRPASEITAYNGFITAEDGSHWDDQFVNGIPFSSAQRKVWRDLGFGEISNENDRATGNTIQPSTSNLSSTQTANIKPEFVKESFGTEDPAPTAVPKKYEFFWLGRQLLAHRHDMERKARDLVTYLKYGSPAAVGVALAGPGPSTDAPPTGKVHPGNSDTCVRNYSRIQRLEGYDLVFSERKWKCHLRETNKNTFDDAPVLVLQGPPGPEVVVGNDFLADLKAAPFQVQVEVLSNVLPCLSATNVGREYLTDLFKYRDRGGMVNPLHVLEPPELSSSAKLRRTGDEYISATRGQKQAIFTSTPHEGKLQSDRIRNHIAKIVPELLVGSSLFYAEAIQSDGLDENVAAQFNGMVREAFTRKIQNAEYQMVVNDRNLTEPTSSLQNHGPRNYGGKPSKYDFDEYSSLVNNTLEVSGAINDSVDYGIKAKHGWDWSSTKVTGVDASLAASDVFLSLTTLVHDVATAQSLPAALGEIATFAGTKWHSLALASHSFVSSAGDLVQSFDPEKYFGDLASDRVATYLGGVGVLYSIINYAGLIYDSVEWDILVLNGIILGADIILFGLEVVAELIFPASVGGPLLVGVIIVSTIIALVGNYLHDLWKDTAIEDWLEQSAFGIKWGTGNYKNPDKVEYQFQSDDKTNFQAQAVKHGSVAAPMNFEANTFPQQGYNKWTLDIQLDPEASLRQGGALYIRPVMGLNGNASSGYSEIYTLPWLHRLYLSETESEIEDNSRLPIFPNTIAKNLNTGSGDSLARHQLAFSNWINGHMASKRNYDPSVAKQIADHAVQAANNGNTITNAFSQYQTQSGLPFWGSTERNDFTPRGDSEHNWSARIGTPYIPNRITPSLDPQETSTNDESRLEKFRVELTPPGPNAAGIFGATQKGPQGGPPTSFDISHFEAVYVPASSYIEVEKQDLDVNTMEVPFTIGSKWEIYKRSP